MKKLLVLLAMLVTVNANAQWVQTNIVMPQGTYSRSILNIGENIYAGIWGKGVFYTSNNGNNWTDITNNTSINIYTIACNKNYLFAGAYGSGTIAPIYRSSDLGQTWNNVGNNIPYYLVSNIFTKGDTVFASVWSLKENNMFDFAFYFSTNNGNAWSNIWDIYFGVGGFVTDGTNMFLCSGYGVFKSSDCINWNKVNNGLTDTVITSLAYDEINNILYAGTYSHGVFSSIDNGNNWIPKNAGIVNSAIMALRVQGNIVIAGTGNGVYKSSNYGTNWISIGLSNMSLTSFACNYEYLFASTVYNSIWRRPLSEIIGINNISTETPSKYSLAQNYPNPFNPITNIKFSIVNSGDVKLVVYDIQGREVQTLVNESLKPGTYEAAFDGSMLTSGVYFYKLMTNGFTETKRMVLIK
ncbi:MAG: T9SS type A sorting domain-containing protein [Ignavibacteriae bacterium]|nr:T9SS type A sorting domain-containing protein [Ignavibacteriota bacterium]